MKVTDTKGFDLTKAHIPVELALTLGDIFILHGQLSLSLRHPLNTGPTIERTRRIINQFEQVLYEQGMIDDDGLRIIKADERRAREDMRNYQKLQGENKK